MPDHTFYIQVRLADNLSKQFDQDQLKSADDKKHSKFSSMQRVESTGHGFDLKIDMSEFVNGGMPPAKVSLRWSVKDFRRI